MKPGALVVASEKAGGTDADSLRVAVETLGADFTVELATTADPAELTAVLDRLGDRLLVIAGGDGSLHVVVEALYRRGQLGETDLALVPLGTGNDFAQTLGIPVDAAAAAGLVGLSVRRPLDLLVDDRGEVVVNVVHGGVGADAAERAAGLKPVLGAAAYPLGAVLAAARCDGWNVTVEVDGVVAHKDAPLLMVAMCNGRTVGGGTELCPVADPGDGLVDVVVVTAVDVTARLAFGADLRKGEHLGRADVAHTRGRSVTVAGEPMGYNADGEIGDPVGSKTFAVLPGVWTLRTPQDPPAVPRGGGGHARGDG